MSRFSVLRICIGVWIASVSVALADVPGDADGDLDVDLGDFELLTLCQFGPDVPAIGVCQDLFDFDLESDVDVADLAILQRCFHGPKQPVDPNCAPHFARIEGDCLFVIGTAADYTLALRLRSGDSTTLEIDVDDDGAEEFSFSRADFDCIVVAARGGDDLVRIDEQHGVFTDIHATAIHGGSGNDTLIGGSGDEEFTGDDGNDTIRMGGGSDRFTWNPGDDTDLVDGDADADIVEVNGGNTAEQFTITANGTRVRFDRINPGAFNLDIGACERLVLAANGGNDSLACTGNLLPLIQITADGGPGGDTLLGSNGADLLSGGDDNDFVDGQQGVDTVLLGSGDDAAQWDPGDGSDTIEGQEGDDTLAFNGSNGSEIFDLSANGSRLRLTRNLGAVVMDVNGVESVDLKALGGTDIATVNDLAATEVARVNIALASTIGGSAGDAAADTITVNGTPLPDAIHVNASLGGVEVTGLSATVRIAASEPANDSLTVNGLGGANTITLGPGVTALIMLNLLP